MDRRMWAVLQRELREQARQDGTYWLRVIAAGIVMLLFWLAWEREANGGQLNGRGYFLGLHRFPHHLDRLGGQGEKVIRGGRRGLGRGRGLGVVVVVAVRSAVHNRSPAYAPGPRNQAL